MDSKTARSFSDSYLATQVWLNTTWLGVRTEKTPTDMWYYQEQLFYRRPDFLIELGTMIGGSALFFASIFDLIGNGQVITIDKEKRECPVHSRIRYITGDCESTEVADICNALVTGKTTVVLDADHSPKSVERQLELFAPLVSSGQLLVVEDTIPHRDINGLVDLTPTVDKFLSQNNSFHRLSDKFYLTFFPGGWLVRDDLGYQKPFIFSLR